MTTVYGVTFVGAREQIEKQLRIAETVDLDMRYQTAAYLTTLVSHTLGPTIGGLLTLVSRHSAALRISSGAPKTSKTGLQPAPSSSAGLFQRVVFPCLLTQR
jgi:hypothetical protein